MIAMVKYEDVAVSPMVFVGAGNSCDGLSLVSFDAPVFQSNAATVTFNYAGVSINITSNLMKT